MGGLRWHGFFLAKADGIGARPAGPGNRKKIMPRCVRRAEREKQKKGKAVIVVSKRGHARGDEKEKTVGRIAAGTQYTSARSRESSPGVP